MLYNYSPLRYPGGKACLSRFLESLARTNHLVGGTYCELYAGGAGAALNLLFNNIFERIHINDADYSIYSFWDAILNHTESFIEKINEAEITITEWIIQKEIFKGGRANSVLDLGFATFFLNRTNRSGIIFKAGPIGGYNQEGNYKIDVRFNKEDLIRRIRNIAERRNYIILTNEDAVNIINNIGTYHHELENLLVYLDPPYYKKGKTLYLNNYNHSDHLTLSNAVENLEDIQWLISYDNVPEIREMYTECRMSTFDLNYTLQEKKSGNELLIFSKNLILPPSIEVNKRTNQLVLL